MEQSAEHGGSGDLSREKKPALLITNGLGALLGKNEVLDLADLISPDIDTGPAGISLSRVQAAKAVTMLESKQYIPWNAADEIRGNGKIRTKPAAGERERNVRLMMLLRAIYSPYFEPILVLNQGIFNKATRMHPPVINTN